MDGGNGFRDGEGSLDIEEMVLGTEEKVPLMKEKGSKGRGEGSLVCHSLHAGIKGLCEIHLWTKFDKFMSTALHNVTKKFMPIFHISRIFS